jgi:GMP synthase (glutamine-hydrolysing)
VRVLSVVHDPAHTGGGGLFEKVVAERGDTLDRWVVANGEAVPGDPSLWDAVMVFGGAMHPDQDAEHPWLGREVDFIAEALSQGVPTIGVCLGAQLVARAAGAGVGPADRPEVGWFTVELSDDGACDPVVGVLPPRVDAFQWHYYTYGVPAGGIELARSASCTQAFRLGESVWGVQFHPEVTESQIGSWLSTDGFNEGVDVDRVAAETRERIAEWNGLGSQLCDAFLTAAERLASVAAR